MSTVADPKLKDKPQPGAAVKPDAVLEKEAPMGEGAMAFISTSLNLTSRKKKDEKPEPKAKAKEGDDDELDELPAKPAAVAPPAKPAPKPRAQQTAAIDEDKLGEAVGRSVVKAMNERDKPAAPEKEQELPPDVKDELKRYERLAKHFPEKYKDHAKKFLANTQKFAEYSEKWENDHPGQEFNDADPEHREFRSKLEAETEYDTADDSTSQVRDEIAEERKKLREEVDKELEPIRRREKIAEKSKEIVSNRDKVGDRFWQRMGDGFTDVLDENGQLNPKALAELKTSDPLAHDIAVNGAAFVEALATEVYLLDNGLADYDKANQNHQFLSDFSLSAEQKMAARSPEKQLDDQGRRFLPRGEYNKLSATDAAKHWTFSYEDLGYLIAADIAKKTAAHLQSEEEKFSARAKARGLLNGDKSLPLKSQRQAAKPPEPEEELDEKPLSPTTPTAPRLASSRGKPAATSSEPLGAFATRGIHGR